MTSLALLFTLAAIGISETAYLIRKRRASERPVCVIGDDCTVVLTSKYNRLFGIHNDIAGMLFYILCCVLTALLLLGIGPTPILFQAFGILLAGGSLMSLMLVYIQWRVIKAWCFWCVMSAITNWLMSIIFGLSLSIS